MKLIKKTGFLSIYSKLHYGKTRYVIKGQGIYWGLSPASLDGGYKTLKSAENAVDRFLYIRTGRLIKTNPVKKRRTAAQIRATKKLVALNKRRRSTRKRATIISRNKITTKNKPFINRGQLRFNKNTSQIRKGNYVIAAYTYKGKAYFVADLINSLTPDLKSAWNTPVLKNANKLADKLRFRFPKNISFIKVEKI